MRLERMATHSRHCTIAATEHLGSSLVSSVSRSTLHMLVSEF
jgi:hypothetical protein